MTKRAQPKIRGPQLRRSDLFIDKDSPLWLNKTGGQGYKQVTPTGFEKTQWEGGPWL